MLAYTLDSEDRIMEIEGPWGEFAAANGCPALTRTAVRGRVLFDFVTGSEAQELSRLLLARARAGRIVDVGFRCDSPSLRRFLRLNLHAETRGRVRCSSTLVRQETRPAQPLLDATGPRSPATVRICSWCKKVDVRGAWKEVEEATAQLRLMEGDMLPGLHHGICPVCRAAFR
jgi:hypothetical protein